MKQKFWRMTLCWEANKGKSEIMFAIDSACKGMMDNLEFLGFKWVDFVDGTKGKTYTIEPVWLESGVV